MSSKRKVCIVTGSRAEYGLFYPIIKKIQESDKLTLQLVATTMHMSEEFGLTYTQIEADGFKIDFKVENLLVSDSASAMAKSTGLAVTMLSDVYNNLQPDTVLLLGDRFETHAAATTAMLMNIPISHIHGGEITEGAVDEQIRHSITKMSYFHFVATEEYKKRVIQMGESPERVFYTGAPGLDNIINMPLLEKSKLEKDLGWKLKKPTALFTFHAETLSPQKVSTQIINILSALKSSNLNIIFTYANADNGGRVINKALEKFVSYNDKNKYLLVQSLGTLKYLSAMKYVDLLIGNTSSGIIEAASFQKPVINIGDRQKGRLQSGNIINCEINNLLEALNEATNDNFLDRCRQVKNIYGAGSASKEIVKQLEQQPLSSVKKFYDL